MQPRVLIVGTVPFNNNATSRALDAFFHFYPREKLAHIFSNAKEPCKGHCETLYQITDSRLLKSVFDKSVKVGKLYNYENLKDNWDSNELDVGKKAKRLYEIGASHKPVIRLMRKWLWNKKRWCTKEFNEYIENFKPEVIFLTFSDDFFILEIAKYISEKFDIPIVSFISDDYIFNPHFSLDPFYYIYRSQYKKLVGKVLKIKGSAVYISQKIADKYNEEYNLGGKPVYLTSDVMTRDFKEINIKSPLITYFGNIRMGRNNSLNDIGNALGKINSEYKLHIYSGERNEKYHKILKENKNIVFHGSVAYDEVKKQMELSDITVIVEGFKKTDIDYSRYSLSTKAADCIASGIPILAYGSGECGVIDYMKYCGCAEVCTDKLKLKEQIEHLMFDKEFQKEIHSKSSLALKERHNLIKSTKTFEEILNSVF